MLLKVNALLALFFLSRAAAQQLLSYGSGACGSAPTAVVAFTPGACSSVFSSFFVRLTCVNGAASIVPDTSSPPYSYMLHAASSCLGSLSGTSSTSTSGGLVCMNYNGMRYGASCAMLSSSSPTPAPGSSTVGSLRFLSSSSGCGSPSICDQVCALTYTAAYSPGGGWELASSPQPLTNGLSCSCSRPRVLSGSASSLVMTISTSQGAVTWTAQATGGFISLSSASGCNLVYAVVSGSVMSVASTSYERLGVSYFTQTFMSTACPGFSSCQLSCASTYTYEWYQPRGSSVVRAAYYPTAFNPPPFCACSSPVITSITDTAMSGVLPDINNNNNINFSSVAVRSSSGDLLGCTTTLPQLPGCYITYALASSTGQQPLWPSLFPGSPTSSVPESPAAAPAVAAIAGGIAAGLLLVAAGTAAALYSRKVGAPTSLGAGHDASSGAQQAQLRHGIQNPIQNPMQVPHPSQQQQAPLAVGKMGPPAVAYKHDSAASPPTPFRAGPPARLPPGWSVEARGFMSPSGNIFAQLPPGLQAQLAGLPPGVEVDMTLEGEFFFHLPSGGTTWERPRC